MDNTNRTLFYAVVLVAAVFLAGPALGMLGMMAAMFGAGWGPLAFGGRMPFGVAGGMFVLWLVIVALIVAAFVAAARRAPAVGAPREDALAILSRRYAAGELSREDYERMRADLLRDRAPS